MTNRHCYWGGTYAQVWCEKLTDGSLVYDVMVSTDGGWRGFANASDAAHAVKAAEVIDDAYKLATGDL